MTYLFQIQNLALLPSKTTNLIPLLSHEGGGEGHEGGREALEGGEEGCGGGLEVGGEECGGGGGLEEEDVKEVEKVMKEVEENLK